MAILSWTTRRRTSLDRRDQDALVGFSSGASTDDDGLPHTPPDLPFIAPALKASLSSPSSSHPPSTVLEIALAESSLSPFSHRNLSRSPSPPPSPQLASASTSRQDRHRSLPAGFEHIPWISDDDDSDVEGRLSRSLSPPLHDLLSLPPLSPDVDHRGDDDGEAKLDGEAAAALSPASTSSDLPPSPPRTPSPRRRFASLSNASTAEHDLPWATSSERAPPSPDRSSGRSSPSPRRRSSTRSGLPTLRAQLSPPHPSPTSTTSPASRSSPSTSPDKPVRPTLLRESSTTTTSTTSSRRPALPVSQAPSPPPSPRSRAALQLPTPDDVRARHAATRSGERGRPRDVEREGGAAAGTTAGDGLQLSFSTAPFEREDEREIESKRRDDVAAAHGPVAAEGDGPLVDEADPHSLDYFERHCHSLSLLRLRHALSVATVLASLPPSAPPSPPSSSSESDPSPSRAGSTPRREPLVAHVPGLSSTPSAAAAVGPRPPSSRPSSSSTPLGAGNGAGSMVSQQYRLYAMGRAKAQRTGGVGYWEGGLAAWELLLMD
ncbi:hypothetical protein JCM3775_001352 [Rhodotorula graminis]|uniref:Uncharacterized protein n=1 Tax=Rhodotorula graminis (strain WP1) TaxID=578459 RepID=A0A194S0W2_RHOGW|nr:uncharacterized protein RHOBADRAFT_54205 [Rhodotorula graminis WP1]KPV74368.1 hypothetical protein RHOBADRAFT_54205 [Rhodotorula graminis WP1]